MPLASLAAILICTAPAVHDGDTIRCGGERVRLWGMDAPELSGSPRCRYDQGWACEAAMAWGDAARRRLVQLTAGHVACTPVDRDRYGRVVARCTSAGVDVGGRLVAEGLARDYTRYSRGAYLLAEARARRGAQGMWSSVRVQRTAASAPKSPLSALSDHRG